MRISMSNNPLDRLSCYIHNRIEDLSQIIWIMGKNKKVKCKICGNVLNSWRDMYSPMQCGWCRIDRYTWICHQCLEHRDFKKYIKQIDQDANDWESEYD